MLFTAEFNNVLASDPLLPLWLYRFYSALWKVQLSPHLLPALREQAVLQKSWQAISACERGHLWQDLILQTFDAICIVYIYNFPLLRIFELQPFAFAFDTVRGKGCFVSDGHTE